MAARPYARHLRSVIASVAARVPASLHPLLRTHPPGQGVSVLVVTADRGLCGSFNANVLRRTRRFLIELEEQKVGPVRLYLVGRKAAGYFKVHPVETFGAMQDFFRDLNFSHGVKVADHLVSHYLSQTPTTLYVIYNEFKSAVAQKLVVEPLLPFSPADLPPAGRSDYIYEPADPSALLTSLIQLHMEVQIYTIFMESYAAEQAARMTAMENAADNAVELTGDLTLIYNRARQAGITKEIAEIVGGAEALK